MLLTDTVAPEQPTGQIWLWVLAASVVVLVAVSAYALLRLRRTRAHAAHTAARDAALLDEARAENARLQTRIEELRSALTDRDRTTRAVATETFPLVTRRIREGASTTTVLAELDKQGESDPATRRLTESMTNSLWHGHQQRRRLLGVVKGCGARVRAGVAQLRADVQERSAPYWNSLESTQAGEQVREDFMALEAGLARLEMLVQRLLTVVEADRVGRNWTRPLRIERVIRAAIGSVPDFSRVQMHPMPSPVMVEGRAVNAVMQVAAELVDNATSFSAPSERVVVHFESTAMRLGVHIDDSGLAMTEEQLSDVRKRLDPNRRPDIAQLSANQLGLLVVRRSADPLGIQVDIGPSPRGGTRATMWIPRNGLLRTDEAATSEALPVTAGAVAAAGEIPAQHPGALGRPPSRSTTETSAAAESTGTASAGEGGHAGDKGPEHAEWPDQLPRRRRGSTLSEEPSSSRGIEAPRDRTATSNRIAQWHAHTRPTPPAKNREDS